MKFKTSKLRISNVLKQAVAPYPPIFPFSYINQQVFHLGGETILYQIKIEWIIAAFI